MLDADPDLAHALAPQELAVARRYAVAEVIRLEPGTWRPAEDCAGEPGMLGLLLLDGLLTRDVVLGGRRCTELLGEGDLLRPWDFNDAASAAVPSESEWCVLEPSRLAVLGHRVTRIVGHWPELTSAFVSRTLRRSRGLALQLAIDHVRRVDVRTLLMLWHLADRWGKVGPEGVIVPLRLTHQTLANLTGARRPSVTTALSQLVRLGAVRRRPDGSWLLRGDPPCEYTSLAAVVSSGEAGLAASAMRATRDGDAALGPELCAR
ncbi:MAG: Crp/Fnr family transcriptional regulator [Actinomycetota bacterium]|nr:Crp/Fnr family transcriptional regulator [Actinomycetota bacterium]